MELVTHLFIEIRHIENVVQKDAFKSLLLFLSFTSVKI